MSTKETRPDASVEFTHFLDAPINCPRCNRSISELTCEPVEASNGVRHVKGRCPRCKNFVKFVSQGKPAVFHFGKYKGSTVESVAENDPGYLSWLLEQPWLKTNLRRAITEALN